MESLKKENEIYNFSDIDSLKYCKTILPNVSRSFAIGIEFLKGDLQKSVLVGYLLCRIIDTVEDDRYLDLNLKKQYLNRFIDCFSDVKKANYYNSIADELTGDKYHIDLVRNTNKVFQIYYSLSANTQKILKKWVTEMSNGMALFVTRYPNGIRIVSLNEYKEYCYYVAGTVGYILTELWKEYGSFINDKSYQIMLKNSVIFGEALQTINILKDIAWDAKGENSIYIPSEILLKYGITHDTLLIDNLRPKAELAINEIIHLAYQDIQISLEYLKSIPRINFRIRFFCIFPLLLALATLKKFEESENKMTPENVIKVTRSDVKKIKILSLFASIFNFLLNIPALRFFKI